MSILSQVNSGKRLFLGTLLITFPFTAFLLVCFFRCSKTCFVCFVPDLFVRQGDAAKPQLLHAAPAEAPEEGAGQEVRQVLALVHQQGDAQGPPDEHAHEHAQQQGGDAQRMSRERAHSA